VSRPDLFVGVTSFNSATFLGACLDGVRTTTDGSSVRVVVFDNVSADGSAEIARERGADVVVRNASQGEALSRLLGMSNAPFTLLLHSDVVLLSAEWFPLCRGRLTGGVVLVSPADVGLGPFTRGFRDRPESSFLFFATSARRALRRWRWRRRLRVPYPSRRYDFFGDHVTHRIPEALAARSLGWSPMDVYTSPAADAPIYRCDFGAVNWKPDYALFAYGFGNFYGIEGRITHYHNWYDRVERVPSDSTRVHPTDGLPLAFLRVYGERFLDDLAAGSVRFPGPAERWGAA